MNNESATVSSSTPLSAPPAVMIAAYGESRRMLSDLLKRSGCCVAVFSKEVEFKPDLIVVDWLSVTRDPALADHVEKLAVEVATVFLRLDPLQEGAAISRPRQLLDRAEGMRALEALVVDLHLMKRVAEWVRTDARQPRAGAGSFPLMRRLQELEELAIRTAMEQRGSSRGGASLLGLLAQTLRAKRSKLCLDSPVR
jgi:hypothetical protein